MIITLAFNLESHVPTSFLNFGRKIENIYYNHNHQFLQQLCVFKVYKRTKKRSLNLFRFVAKTKNVINCPITISS